MTFVVLRDGQEISIPVTPRRQERVDRFGNKNDIGIVGSSDNYFASLCATTPHNAKYSGSGSLGTLIKPLQWRDRHRIWGNGLWTIAGSAGGGGDGRTLYQYLAG